MLQGDTVSARTVKYFNNANGQVLKRDDGNYQTYWYYAQGQRVGDVSTDPAAGSYRVSYAESLAQSDAAKAKPIAFRYLTPVTSADFDQNYEPVRPTYPPATGSAYTVRTGDTLKSVAQALWGDSAMWYLIAEANGLSSAQSLTPGQVLVIPNKLTNIHNNASTFRPYNPGEAIGHIDPTLPAPPPQPVSGGDGDDGGCGGLGTILIIAVAIVATVYTAGAAAGLLAEAGALTGAAATSTWAAGMAAMSGGLGASLTGVAIGAAAIGAAAGSVASQGVAMAMGMQQDFSWNQVGQAALGGAITAGVGSGLNNLATAGSLSPTMSSWLTDSGSWQGAALKGGIGSVISQAAHGGSFSWRQVAAGSRKNTGRRRRCRRAGCVAQISGALQGQKSRLGALGRQY